MSKLIVTLSLAGLLLTSASMCAYPTGAQSQSDQQSAATKTVAGKVTSIGGDGHSFSLDVNEGGTNQTMQFVVDKSAKVQGALRVGTPVSVEYAVKEGQNVALTITVQS